MKPVADLKEAFEAQGLDPNVLPDVSMIPEQYREAITSFYQMMVVTDAINENKEPDWNNMNDEKWFPVTTVDADEERPAGFGLSLHGTGFTRTFTHLGSRLSYREESGAIHSFENFKPLWEGFLLKIKK